LFTKESVLKEKGKKRVYLKEGMCILRENGLCIFKEKEKEFVFKRRRNVF